MAVFGLPCIVEGCVADAAALRVCTTHLGLSGTFADIRPHHFIQMLDSEPGAQIPIRGELFVRNWHRLDTARRSANIRGIIEALHKEVAGLPVVLRTGFTRTGMPYASLAPRVTIRQTLGGQWLMAPGGRPPGQLFDTWREAMLAADATFHEELVDA